MADKASPAARPPQPLSLKHTADLNYMHRPPRIVPNYGKKHRGTLPKSNISRVLLYDNVTQQQMLDVKMAHLKTEQRKTGRLMDMNRKSFIVRRLMKQRHIADTVLHVQDALRHKDDASSNGHVTNTVNGRQPVPVYTLGFSSIATVARANSIDEKVNSPTLDGQEEEAMTDRRSSEDKEQALDTVSLLESHAENQQSLPTLNHERNGAVTSNGFVNHGLGNGAGMKNGLSLRPTQTALVYRDLRLPEINNASASPQMDKVILRMDSDRHGLTRMLHTFHEPNTGWRSDRKKGKHAAATGSHVAAWASHVTLTSAKAAEDDRYRKLEKLLVRDVPPNEGYLELSPSFHSPRQSGSFTRPTTTSFRRYSQAPSVSAPPSPVPLSVAIGSL